MSDRLKGSLAKRYRIERELGQGGMATVYLAHDVRHERSVAVKVLRPELSAILGADRFLAEIKTTANLQHPHILSLFDSGEADGLVYYVMPHVEGESLRDRLTREHQLPVEDAVRIASEVAAALDYAHRHGVVHRDIKPENILLHDGSALVADFGIALAVSRSDGGTRMTETGMSLGTPHYMAPEQAMGEREITPRADIYALGCVLYEMLAGEPPFTGPTAQAIIARVMTEEPRSLILQRKTIPPQVEATVVRALEKLPADRFATAAQFAESLSRPGAVPAAPVTTVLVPAAARSRRSRALLPWGVALLAAGVAAWGWFGRPHRPRPSWHYVELSDSIQVAAGGSTLAVSPDGRSVVFKDPRQNGLLWIKRWDQLEADPIPGTERAFGPAFSPDGAWIAYAADGRLKKVRTGGGSSVTLSDSIAVQGGAYNVIWLDDGSLVYTGAHLDVLYRSPSGGGASVLLADSALRGYGLQNLAPLPQARGVLFQACGSGCVPTSVRVLDLRTGRAKILLDDMIAAWYLPTGHLLYFRRDGVALAAPFDLDRLEITGPVVPVLDRVLSGASVVMLAWSPNGTLVYLQSSGSGTDAEFVWVNRQGVAVPVDSSWSGGFNSSELSPDGRRLAVGAGLAARTLGIWIKQLDRGPFARLTFGGQDRRPTWSPDGRTVAFIQDSGNGGSVYAHPADGSGANRLLARIDRPIQEVAWSPDGNWLVLRTDNGTAGVGDLVGVRLTGDTAPVPLVASPYTELHPAFSPDSKWLAYTSNESGINQVYVRPFPGTSGGRWQVSNGGGIEPRWSRDGRELFFLDAGSRELLVATVRTSPAFEVLRVEPLFGVTTYRIDPFHQSYDVAADGRSFLFSRFQANAGRTTPRVVLVDNWFEDLRVRLKQ